MNRFVAIACVLSLGVACAPKPKGPSCPSGQTSCAGECVATQTDVDNCGVCANKCSVPDGTPVCRIGSCNIATCDQLEPGVDGGCGAVVYLDCDAMEANGCEVNPQTDPNNCGSCGNVCFFANAAATCSPGATPGACTTGSCVMGSCNAGFANCDMSSTNGCETNTATDPFNCGTCGNACTGTNPICTGGTCG